jgi:DNA-binding transcriptional LysR family regulator
LEHDLGATLFDRDRHRVALTPAGRQLLADAPALLAAAAATRRRVAAADRGTRSLSVGFRAGIVVTAAVRAFRADHPDTSIDLRHLEWDRQEEPILDGRVDIAYLRPPVADTGLTVTVLYHEQRVAVLPADHRLAGRTTVAMADLAAELLLPAPGIVPPHHPSRSHTPKAIRTVEEKWEHVAAGNGVLFVAASMARYYRRDDIVSVPLSDAPPDQVLLATATGRTSPLVDAFIRAARQTAAPNGSTATEPTTTPGTAW